MTIVVSLSPKTIEQGYDGVIVVSMTLSGNDIDRANYLWGVSNPSLTLPNQNICMLSGTQLRTQTAAFTVPADITRGQHPFTITGENSRANGIIGQLPSLATLTLNVNTAVVPSADSANIAFTPADSSALHRGDEIYLDMSLVNASAGDDFVFRFTSTADIFEPGDLAGTFTIRGTEAIQTFVRVRADAPTSASGTLTIEPVNDAAMAIASLITTTHSFQVVPVPAPSVDSFDIAFTPTDVQRGQEIFITMSMVNPSDHSFIFRLLSTSNVFEVGTYEFTIEGDETVRTFIRVKEDAILEPGVLRIVPHNDAARAVGTELTASGNEHSFLVVESAAAIDDRVPSDVSFDMDSIRLYFEELLFLEKFRLPSVDAWNAIVVANHGLVLTNLLIQIDGNEDFQIPFIADGTIADDYKDSVNKYPAQAYIRLSIRAGESRQVTIGETPTYRFSGVAFFQVFVNNRMPAKTAIAIHTELTRYVLGWKTYRRRTPEFASITVLPPNSSFGIDAISDGYAQSNLSFPYNFDLTV